MKTEWDYSQLADAYLDRPPYAKEALENIFTIAGLDEQSLVCDIGAGVGHLTIPLAEKGCTVIAVEPNDAMRANGIQQTSRFAKVSWVEAGGEDTRQTSGVFDFVCFGSSFNVMDRQKALKETHRLLKPGKYFACMWNHRDLSDPVQKHIEAIIKTYIPRYGYGSRREDQSQVIRESGLFEHIQFIEKGYVCRQETKKAVEAWYSHATLQRQAGNLFADIMTQIKNYLQSLGTDYLDIPYTTRAWAACRVR